MKYTSKIITLQIATILCATSLSACGDTEQEPTTAQEDVPPCQSRGEGDGIWGRVVVPSCEIGVPSAKVIVLDQLQFEVAEVTTDEKGQFQISASALPGDGTYILRATSGPYTGPASPMRFDLKSGRSPYQIIKINGEP